MQFSVKSFVLNSRAVVNYGNRLFTFFVCNGKREVWTDYEEAKAYFLELMMSTDGEEHERAECVYIQLMHGLDECSDVD